METARNLQILSMDSNPNRCPEDLEECFAALGIALDDTGRYDRLPFTGNDITAGSETELQASAVGC